MEEEVKKFSPCRAPLCHCSGYYQELCQSKPVEEEKTNSK